MSHLPKDKAQYIEGTLTPFLSNLVKGVTVMVASPQSSFPPPPPLALVKQWVAEYEAKEAQTASQLAVKEARPTRQKTMGQIPQSCHLSGAWRPTAGRSMLGRQTVKQPDTAELADVDFEGKPEVDLRHVHLTLQDALWLGPRLLESGIDKLSLNNIDLDIKAWKEGTVKDVDAVGCAMDDTELVIFSSLLASNESIQILRLSGDQFGQAGLMALAEAMGKNKSLKELDLNGRSLHFDGVSCLATQVVEHPEIENVSLNVPVNVKALRENTLENVSWALSTLGDRGDRRKGVMDADVVLLAHCIEENTSVKQIDLSSNYVTDLGVKPLAKALVSTSVTSINLSKNRVGDDGAVALAEAIQHGALSYVDLSSYNFVTDQGARALAQAISAKARGTVTLRLASNQIGDEGALALAESAKDDKAQINLAYNDVSDNARDKINKLPQYKNLEF